MHTLILRIIRLQIQDIIAVSNTTRTTAELRPTPGVISRLLWRSRSRSRLETRGGRDRTTTRPILTCRRNTYRARRMQHIPLRQTTRSTNPSILLRT